VPCSGARRQHKVLDGVSATIQGDEVALNVLISGGGFLPPTGLNGSRKPLRGR